MKVDRRQVLSGAAATAFAAVVASPAALAAARDATELIRSTAGRPGKAAPPLDFGLFYDLSRFVTARVELDRDLARALFDLFRQEEWAWANAASLYGIIHDELKTGIGSAPELLARGWLSDGDLWFGQHVLEAWYEGFYRFEGREIRVTYEGALMWEAVAGIVPVQGLSDAEYGYWATRPAIGNGR